MAKRFVVRWQVEVEAYDAEHAAVKARRLQMSTAPDADRFVVVLSEGGDAYEFAVDLSRRPVSVTGEAAIKDGRKVCPTCEVPVQVGADMKSRSGVCPRCKASLRIF